MERNVIMYNTMYDNLENLVDEWGVGYILEALSVISFAKAQHTKENGDESLADAWDTVGDLIEKAEYEAKDTLPGH